jgi:hypothetical protein
MRISQANVVNIFYIFFSIWRKCCLAFGQQCIDNDDDPIKALSYFLAVNDTNSCIKHLCDRNYYREAWCVAKMRKDDEDPVFEDILEKWLKYYDSNGNYESAAAL